MKKTVLFILSVTVAFGITFYIKKEQSKNIVLVKTQWKTFVKNPDAVVDSHHTTNEEFKAAKIPVPTTSPKVNRTIASVNPFKGFMVRNNRILTGDVSQKYEDDNTELQMVNSINPDWKDIMGNDLMRFQPADTKLMVKEEVPVIKIVEGQGRYLEQVTVTYLQKDGNRSSFKALVDSETGSVVETWDRTIQEHIRRPRGGLFLPSTNESGIVTK
jgi:hypothetical protein